MSNKIHDKELSKGTSFLTNAFLKTPIFCATTNDSLIEKDFEMFNYKLNISGKQLNNSKDLDLFLWIINRNEREIKTTFKEILEDIGVISKKVRINKVKKDSLRKSIHKLNTTAIRITHNDLNMEKYFHLINDVDIIEDEIHIRVNETVCNLYKQEKLRKFIKIKTLDGLNQYERSLYLFICSYGRGQMRVSIDKLKDRFAYNLENKHYKQQLVKTLKSLKKKQKIGSYVFDKDVLYVFKSKETKSSIYRKLKKAKQEMDLIEKNDEILSKKEIKDIENGYHSKEEIEYMKNVLMHTPQEKVEPKAPIVLENKTDKDDDDDRFDDDFFNNW